MNLSMNLDEYLSSYDSFTFCRDLLREYFTGYRFNPQTQRDEKKFNGKSPFEDSYGVIDDKDGQAFYYKTNGSQDYYRRLLQENYNTLYQLILIHITRAGEELSWHDWYLVACNAYKMKGNIASLKYILQHFGDQPLTGTKGKYNSDSGYDTDLEEGEEANVVYEIYRSHEKPYKDLDVYKITLSLNVSTSNADLSKYLLETLARELLIIEESGAVFNEQEFSCVVVFKQNIGYTFDYQLHRQIELPDCLVLGDRINMLDVNLPNDRNAFIKDGHNLIEEYDPNLQPWSTTYNYKTAVTAGREELDGKNIPYAYLNTGVPLFTWYALGRIHLTQLRRQTTYSIQYNTEVTPVLIDAPFYYKIAETLGFKFGFKGVVASSRSDNKPILNNDISMDIEQSTSDGDLFKFTSPKLIDKTQTDQS